jgi:hypothetical protein
MACTIRTLSVVIGHLKDATYCTSLTRVQSQYSYAVVKGAKLCRQVAGCLLANDRKVHIHL